MKRYSIVCCMLMALPYSILSQVSINDALLNKGEMLTLNRAFTLSSGSVRKISFGPFKTVDIHKGKQHLVGRQKDAYLDISGKNAGMKRSVSKINSQPFSLTITEDGGDTIISNLELTTIKGGNHALVEMSSGKSSDEESVSSYCDDVAVQIKNDSLPWRMPSTDDQQIDYNDFPLSFDRILSNGIDKIYVTGANGFPVKRKAFENHTKGIVFVLNKKQLAALETYPETTIWFSNDINKNHKQVIAGVVISLLSTAGSLMR